KVMIEVQPVSERRVRETCVTRSNRPEQLLEILHDVQNALGFASKELSAEIAPALKILPTKKRGAIGLYHDYRREPLGRHMTKMCPAEAWQSVNGSEEPDE
ncbi:MAG: NAD(P)H-dependent oxidoreductase subunit E, partial [Phycisphaerae bacterium]|nr:NAD(P)H-dependent oxidoreductase subunit E [Phycisphaerae bacterium]